MAKTNYNEIKVAAARTALFKNITDVIEKINIHDVLKLSSGENLPTHKMIDGNYPVFGGGGETGLTHNIFNVDFETLAIGRVGARCGCVFKVPKQSWVTDNALYALSFDKRFLLDFLIHYLNYVDLNQYANRAAQPVISLKRISSINFPLIDEERQKAFVEIIEQVENGETHFGDEYSELNNALKSVDRINELQTELSFLLTQVENLNQAILQEAVQGKLVPQDPNDEPASELLKRIKAEKEKSGKKEKPLPPIKTEEIPFEIPESWVWCRLGEITNYGSSPKAEPSDLNNDTWVLDLEDIEKTTSKLLCRIRFNERNSLSTKSVFKTGEVLYSKLRPYLDKVIVADEDGVCTTEILPLKCYAGLNPFYLKTALKRPDFVKYVNSKTKGMKMPRLGTKEGQMSLIPLAPLSEQNRIIGEVEKQLAKTKQLKEHIISNQQATEQLLKALLHEAFVVEETVTV